MLDRLPACVILHGDKGYDANAIRCQIEERGVTPNIPPKRNRKWKNCFSPFLYRNRNAIERMFCVLSPERLPSGGHPLRPERRQLPRRRMHRCHRQLLVISLDPSNPEERKSFLAQQRRVNRLGFMGMAVDGDDGGLAPRLRDFSTTSDRFAVIVVALFTLHDAQIADLTPGHSLLETRL